jgi:hypothetical protein
MTDANEWHDYARGVLVIINLVTLGLMIKRYIERHKGWNSKTRDLWYALFMWTLGGAVLLVQGVYLNTPFGPGFVFLTAATITGLKGTMVRGPARGSPE